MHLSDTEIATRLCYQVGNFYLYLMAKKFTVIDWARLPSAGRLIDAFVEDTKSLATQSGHMEAVARNMLEEMAGNNPERIMVDRPEAQVEYSRRLMRGSSEITGSYDVLREIRSRWRRGRCGGAAKKHAFWMEIAIVEFGVFANRVSDLLQFLELAFARDTTVKALMMEEQRRLKPWIEKRADSLRTVRGAHVHSRRLRSVDRSLRQLDLWETFNFGADGGGYEEIGKMIEKMAVEGISTEMDRCLSVASDIVEKLYDAMVPILVDQKGSLRYPDPLPKMKSLRSQS